MHRDRQRLAVPPHERGDRAADRVADHQPLDVPGVGDRHAVELDDQVARPDAGPGGGAAPDHLDYLDAVLAADGRGDAGRQRTADDDWPTDTQQMVERLPDDWLEVVDGGTRVRRNQRDNLPRPIRLATDGVESEGGIDAWFVAAPFRFCLRCGVAYTARTRSDFGKLATLGTGGRSTATTILSLSVIRGLRHDEDLGPKARKLLSFTDNRQDASLQAGHFNDFIQNSLLRSALYKAADAAPEGLSHDVLAQRVFDALALPLELYVRDGKRLPYRRG